MTNKHISLTFQVAYALPDEIDITAIPGGVLNSHVLIHTSSHHVVESTASSLGVGFISGMFSASGSYQTMRDTLTNHSRFISDATAFHSAFRADVAPFWFMNISRYAHAHIQRRLPPKFDSNPGRYQEFIRYFGTHYFTYAKFGGIFRDYMETKKDWLNAHSERQAEVSAGGSFFNILKANGGYSGSTQKTDAKFEALTNHYTK